MDMRGDHWCDRTRKVLWRFAGDLRSAFEATFHSHPVANIYLLVEKALSELFARASRSPFGGQIRVLGFTPARLVPIFIRAEGRRSFARRYKA